MSSRDEILQRIKQNTLAKHEMPSLELNNALQYSDKIESFIAIHKVVGGKTHLLAEGEDVDSVIKQYYPEAKKIASVLPDIKSVTFNPNAVETAQELNGTDLAIIQGKIGVAENAAVWVPQEEEKHKAIYFISEALIILLDRNSIVTNMHEAYKWLDNQTYKFGVFISGPSKTADIEQALVFGAHGAREVLVILT